MILQKNKITLKQYFQSDNAIEGWLFSTIFACEGNVKIVQSAVIRVRRQTQADAPLSDICRLISFQPV